MPTASLRGTYRFASVGQSAGQIFNGTLPGFNDSRMSQPVITTQAMSFNYTIRPSVFLEATYGRTQNELSGCALGGGGTPGPTFCTDGMAVGSSWPTPTRPALASIPLIYPDARVVDPTFTPIMP